MWVWRIWSFSLLFLLTLTHSVRIVSVCLPHTCLLLIGILSIEIVCSLVLSCVSLKGINIWFIFDIWGQNQSEPLYFILLFYFIIYCEGIWQYEVKFSLLQLKVCGQNFSIFFSSPFVLLSRAKLEKVKYPFYLLRNILFLCLYRESVKSDLLCYLFPRVNILSLWFI